MFDVVHVSFCLTVSKCFEEGRRNIGACHVSEVGEQTEFAISVKAVAKVCTIYIF